MSPKTSFRACHPGVQEKLILLRQQTDAAALEVEREDEEKHRVIRKRTEDDSEENGEDKSYPRSREQKRKKITKRRV